MKNIIKIENIYFSYDKNNNVLNNINMNIKEGMITILLGRNGCGKSTLLDCIIGYHKNYNGNIIINETNINKLSSRNLSKLLSFVPQKIECKIDYTVQEFLLIGRTPYINLGKNYSKNDYDITYNYAKKCNITNLLDKSILNLSVGEQQLVYFTKALIQETPIIVLDEPFSTLDIINQFEILELMKSIANKKNKTILFTTHNPKHSLYLDSDVFLMKDGKIIDKGNAKDLIKQQKLKLIYGDQIEKLLNYM